MKTHVFVFQDLPEIHKTQAIETVSDQQIINGLPPTHQLKYRFLMLLQKANVFLIIPM